MHQTQDTFLQTTTWAAAPPQTLPPLGPQSDPAGAPALPTKGGPQAGGADLPHEVAHTAVLCPALCLSINPAFLLAAFRYPGCTVSRSKTKTKSSWGSLWAQPGLSIPTRESRSPYAHHVTDEETKEDALS